MYILNDGHLDIVSFGKIKLSFDNKDCEIVVRCPDDVKHPVFHILNSKEEDIGWVGIYDTKHSHNLVFTEEDKSNINKFMNSPVSHLAQMGFNDNAWNLILDSFANNFNEYSNYKYYYAKMRKAKIPDYNNL